MRLTSPDDPARRSFFGDNIVWVVHAFPTASKTRSYYRRLVSDDRISNRGKISLFKGKWKSWILRWQMAVLGCEHRCQWNTFNLRREHGAPVWSLQMHFAKKRKCICSSEKYAIRSRFLIFVINSISIMIVDVMSPPYVILLVLGYYVFWGMQGCTSCASLAAWLWKNG